MINTCHPHWNQSFVYPAVRPSDLTSRVLEVTIWDYDRYGANEFLGEVTIDLGATPSASTEGGVEALWHILSSSHGVRREKKVKKT